MKKQLVKLGAIVAGLCIGVTSSLSVSAAGSDWTPCPLCNSTTTVYEVEDYGSSDSGPIDCIHEKENAFDVFYTMYEWRHYYCCDCGAEWHGTVEAGWYRECFERN